MSTELQAVSNAVAEFDRVAAGLADLKQRFHGVVYDVATTKGMTEAKEARAAIRAPRFEVERIRKEAKAPILALGKKLDSEAARITKELLTLEEPVDEVIKAEEARKETERQAKIAAEMKRVADLQERLAELRGCQMLTASSGSILISDHIQDLEEIVVDDTFQEFRQQAEDAKAAGLTRLRELHTAAVAHEAEQEKIRQEREELAHLRAEQARRDAESAEQRAEAERLARIERERLEAEARARREAEETELRRQREAIEADARKERERIAEEERHNRERREEAAREQRERFAEEERQARVVREIEERRIAAERAEVERQAREARERQEAEDRRLAEERARFAAEQEAARKPPEPEHVVLSGTPTAADIVEVLSIHYDEAPETIVDWLKGVDWCAASFEWEKVA